LLFWNRLLIQKCNDLNVMTSFGKGFRLLQHSCIVRTIIEYEHPNSQSSLRHEFAKVVIAIVKSGPEKTAVLTPHLLIAIVCLGIFVCLFLKLS